MSETMGTGGASGQDEVRDEVRLDLDEEKLDSWEDVRGDYAVDPDSEVARPAVGERSEGDLDMAPDGTSADEDD